MARNIVEDVRPRRTIRQVEIKRETSQKRSSDELYKISNRSHGARPHNHFEPPFDNNQRDMDISARPPIGRRLALWIIVLAALVGTFLVITTIFSGVIVNVTPKQQTVQFNSAIHANKDNGELLFQTLTLTKDGKKSIISDQQKEVHKKASGTVTLFNNLNQAQRLVKNTRLQTADGHIYRIQAPVLIPAKTIDKPGSIDAYIVAEAEGSAYNVGLSDFTIPGFKDNPTKYNNIYARSNTAVSGGGSGVVSIVSNDALMNAKQQLETDLKQTLIAQAKGETPDDFIMYNSAVNVFFNPLPSEDKDGTVTVAERATLNGIILKRKALAQALAKKQVEDYNGTDAVIIPDLDKLEATISPANPWQQDSILINLKGIATVVWSYSKQDLANALKGKTTKDVSALLADFPQIQKIDLTMRPIWKRTIPDDLKKINIVDTPIQ